MKRILILSVATMFGAVTGANALTWTANTPLPNAKRNNSVACTTTTLFSIGGRPDVDGTNLQAADDVIRGTINPAGVLTWVTDANSLPGLRTDGGAAVFNGRVYYWGGWQNDFTTLNTCYYAPIGVGEVLGAWVTSAVTIPASGGSAMADSFGRQNLVFNGALYTINGENNAAALQDTAFYSKIAGGGDYGTWTSTLEPGDAATWWHGIATFSGTTQNYIYKIGGGPTSNAYTGALNTVYRSVINPDGSLNAWTLLPGTIPAAGGIMDFGCVQFGTKIYVIGGANGSGTAQTTVYIGTITPGTGDVTWALDSGALPTAKVRVSAGAISDSSGNPYLVILGGAPGTGSTPSETIVYTAPLFTPSSAGNWQLYE